MASAGIKTAVRFFFFGFWAIPARNSVVQYLGHASNSEGGWSLSRAVLFQPGNTFQTPRIAPQLISRCVETFLWRALSSWHPATELPDKRTQGTLLQTPSPASPNHGFRTHAHFARSGSWAHPLNHLGKLTAGRRGWLALINFKTKNTRHPSDTKPCLSPK